MHEEQRIKTKRLEHVTVKVGDESCLIDVDGFAGLPGVTCRHHGNQSLIYVADLSQAGQIDIWVCEKMPR